MNARGWLRIIGFEAVVVAVIVLGVVVLIRGASGADPNHAMAAPPVVTVSLDNVPADIADNYRYAADHMAEFAEIPCYCGCDRSLGHRNLADCYVTADGAWDAHASGCAVCGAETTSARPQIDAGTPIAEVRSSIIEQYGPPPELFTTGATS